eukprot:Phypoly_transcript_02455.p1 GENE.Phypoly_transcript_02455~~Phypoly_transcript_02455.p1  ORF type:complete len:883 (+),score=122.81 Phypoly_transcript_02455:156-2804(+)
MEAGRREGRVKEMLRNYYGANGVDESPTSVDSMAFDIDQYFNEVLRGQDLEGLQGILLNFDKEAIDIDASMKTMVVENYTKFLGVSDTMIEINTKMGGIVAEMEKLNNQFDAIVSDANYLDSRFSRSQSESARLLKMQDLVWKLQYVSSIPDRLRMAVDMEAYGEASKYFQLITKVLARYLHIPSFKLVYDECCEYITVVSQTLKEKLIDPKLNERDSADIVQVLLNFGSAPEQLRALFLFGRTAAIEYNWYHEEKSSTIPGDPLTSVRECNRAFFTHLLMSSYHFKNLFHPPEPEVILEEIPDNRSDLKLSVGSGSSDGARSPSWSRSSSRISNKLQDSPKLRDSLSDSPGKESPVVAIPRPDSPQPIEAPMEDWDKFVLEHFVKYLNRAKMKIMENDNITEKLITMQALSVDISQVHRQMPELPISAIDDLVTDVINDHISKSFANLQDNVIENFRLLQTSVSEAKSLDDASSATAFQDDLEKNTHYVLSHLQSVMNTLTEMFSSSETQFFRDTYQVWVTKVQIKLQQFLLTIITVCSEMCDFDSWPKHLKPAFILSIVHMCLFFKKRGLAQIQKTLDNITSAIERKDIDDEAADSQVNFTFIIAELRSRCKETAEELILLYISAHCKGFERMIKKLLDTSNWLKAREPREVKLGTALIVDDFFKIFVEVSTLFSILPAPKFTKRITPTSSAELRYSATLSPVMTRSKMLRTPSLPTLVNLDKPKEEVKIRHARTVSALPRLQPTTPLLTNSGMLPQIPKSSSNLFLPSLEVEVPVTFVPDEFKCSATYILFRLVQYIFKSFLERVRTKMMSRGGCQQIEVDTEYLKLAFMKVIPDSRIEGFAKAVRKDAATRTKDPQPLQRKIIQQLCKEKAQAHKIAL